MKIFVLIKQVPETDGLVLDEETGAVKRDGVESIVNPLDLYALESASKFKEKYENCEITAISMGPSGAERALREALSMGADKAVLLSDRAFAGSDTFSTSYILSKGIESLGLPELIVCGEKATDGDTSQVGPRTASFLNLPVVSFVSKITVSGSKLILERMVESGVEKIGAGFPLLITVVKAIGEPRLPTLFGKRKAREAGIPVVGVESLELDRNLIGTGGSPTRVYKIHSPNIFRKPVIVNARNDDEIETAVELITDFLRSKGLIPAGGRE